MLDGTVKTVLIDESQPVANLMVVICTKIGKNQRILQTTRHFREHLPLFTALIPFLPCLSCVCPSSFSVSKSKCIVLLSLLCVSSFP